MQKDERLLWDLPVEEIQQLRLLKTADDIQDVKFIRTWMKEGLPCVAISVNGIEMCFDNLDTDDAAAFMNPNYTDAKASIIRTIKRLLVDSGAALDDEDEFEQEYPDDSYGGGDSYGGSW